MATMNFKLSDYRDCSKGFEWEGADCAVRAFTIVTGKSYAEIHSLMKKHGRKDRRGTYHRTMNKVADELGLIKISTSEFKSKHGPTLNRLMIEGAFEAFDFVVVKSGHAFAVKDETVHDWFREKCCRVKTIYAKPKNIGLERFKKFISYFGGMSMSNFGYFIQASNVVKNSKKPSKPTKPTKPTKPKSVKQPKKGVMANMLKSYHESLHMDKKDAINYMSEQNNSPEPKARSYWNYFNRSGL